MSGAKREMSSAPNDDLYMACAIALARHGEGCVEPNPMVGCVLVRAGEVVGEGFHQRFGGPHAEVVALEQAGDLARGATAYVTLEPCCHQGKTPPCTQALVRAGVSRVVAAIEDPYPQVAGRGIAELRAAGVACDVGAGSDEARRLVAPYHKRLATGRPWVIAKWAMTLDGKLATRSGDSQWISSEASRSIVHQLRGRIDAIVVGSGTARADNPLLTARPASRDEVKRVATRVVVDSAAALSLESRLATTAKDVPVLVASSSHAPQGACDALGEAGIEVVRCRGESHSERVLSLLDELGRRGQTNVMVEGGSRLLGTFFELRAVDEVHVFVAPKIVGGQSAPSPVGGLGVERMRDALAMSDIAMAELDGDLYWHGRIKR